MRGEESKNRDLDKVRIRGRMGCGITHQMPEKNQQSMAKLQWNTREYCGVEKNIWL
jgi:hypothetical protein